MTRILITAGVLCALALIATDVCLSYRRFRSKATPYIVMSPDEVAAVEWHEQHYHVQFQEDELRRWLAMRRTYAKRHGSEVAR